MLMERSLDSDCPDKGGHAAGWQGADNRPQQPAAGSGAGKAGATGSCEGIDFELVTCEADILALEADWLALEESAPDTLLFQSFAWCRNHLAFKREEGSFRPVVIVLREAGKVIAILPMCLQRKRGFDILTGFTEPFQQYTELLVAPDTNRDTNLAAAGQALVAAARRTGADMLYLGQVRCDGTLARAVGGLVPPSGETEVAPHVDIAAWADHETYFKSIKPKTRKNMRNARNRLEREGELVHRHAFEGALLRDVIRRAYEGREAWLERTGITSRAFRDEDFEAFLQRFEMPAETGVRVMATSLELDGQSIADMWGFCYKGRFYAFMSGWDTAHEVSSPGKLHLGEVIATAFAEGFEVADFMIPGSPYKFTWTDQAVEVRDLILPLSIPGRLYSSLWFDLARPLAKQVFLRLPMPVKNLLKRLL